MQKDEDLNRNHNIVSQILDEERFDLLRQQFRVYNRTTENLFKTTVKSHERLLLMCKYLQCLSLPIIPPEAMRRWLLNITRVRLDLPSFLVSTSSTFILGMDRSRRDLLLYLLLYMSSFIFRWSDRPSATIQQLASLYGPFICGANYAEARGEQVFKDMIRYAKEIVDEIHKMEKQQKPPGFFDKLFNSLSLDASDGPIRYHL